MQHDGAAAQGLALKDVGKGAQAELGATGADENDACGHGYTFLLI